MQASIENKYSYEFSWLGRPIVQYPQDIVMLQELVWRLRPDLVIETGVAHGGSSILIASLLELNAIAGYSSDAQIVSIELALRDENREAILAHPMSSRIRLIDGSSIEQSVIQRVTELAQGRRSILVILDSNHTHDHVLSELRAYAPLVTPGSYCVVLDTIIEYVEVPSSDRPWGVGNNPATAVREFLSFHSEFEVDQSIDDRLQISVAPGGYLRRIA